MIRYVGLDVHRKEAVVCILDAAGQRLFSGSVACTRAALEQFARERLTAEDQLALEATFNSWSVAEVLHPFVARVVVSNPMETKAIAQAKVKTDKIDAQVLAHLLRCDYLPAVWTPDARTQLLRTLCSRRAGLVGERTRLKNRIHSVLAHALIPAPETDLFSARGQQWLAEQPLSTVEQALIESDRRLLATVEEELAALEDLLAKHAYRDDRVKLLMTLPGVDFTVAQAVLAALGDVGRFREAPQVADYFGLVPSTYQTGGPNSRAYHGPITKQGNRRARWLLIQAAQHVASHPGPLGVFFRRLMKRKNRNVAVVATARKLAVIAYLMLKNHEPYRYAQPKATETKLARLRVRVTGKRKRTGPARTTRPANYGSGIWTRLVPGLGQVYAAEGLPPAREPAALPAGELRMLHQQKVAGYVEGLQEPHRKVRARGTGKARREEAREEPRGPAAAAVASQTEPGNNVA
jgi:transposase